MNAGMPKGAEDLIRGAAEELRQQQARIKEIRKELDGVTFKATSKDRMITVTVDTKGEVASIVFNTAKFRRMAPAELGAILAETIRQARAESRDKVLDAYQSLIPSGMGLADAFSGKGSLDLDKIFDDAFSKANEAIPGLLSATTGFSPRKG